MTLKDALNQYERELIAKTWQEHNGSPIGTSLALGIDRRGLFARMTKYGMHAKPMRKPKYRLDLADMLRKREREIIIEAIKEHGTRREAALALGVSEMTLYNKLARHAIEG